MTVIDVTMGSRLTVQGGSLEQAITGTDLEAAEEIVTQLRLRDIGGIISIDFIDMANETRRDLVLRRLIDCLARDRAVTEAAEVTSLVQREGEFKNGRPLSRMRQQPWRHPVAADLAERLRAICLALPEVNERPSHGAPAFFVRDKKSFLQLWASGHHDDDFPHLWCAAPPSAQAELVAGAPDGFRRRSSAAAVDRRAPRRRPRLGRDQRTVRGRLPRGGPRQAGSRPRRTLTRADRWHLDSRAWISGTRRSCS